MTGFAEGVMAYHAYPRQPRAGEPPVIWQDGTTRVLDYGPANGKALFIVPSLVNRAYILDLAEGRSFCRWLSARGFRPLLVDWGAPGPEEKDFGLDAYIATRLQGAFDAARGETGKPIGVVGYCMGGNLALALAHRNPGAVSALALLATPWDFHAGMGGKTGMLAAALPQLDMVLEACGEMPVDTIQAFFTGIDPFGPSEKFRRFAGHHTPGEQADLFVALEDLLNDGVPLAANTARDCLRDWYVENLPARGGWRVGGTPVIPEEVDVPTLLAIPERDHIVPPASARALLDALPRVEALSVPAGHIGMMAGSRAEAGLYQPLARWLGEIL